MSDNSDHQSRSNLSMPFLASASPMFRRRVLFFSAALLTFVLLIPLLPGLLLGAALAFLSEPLQNRLESLLRVRRKSSRASIVSVFTVILVSLIFLLPFFAVVVGALKQISSSVGAISSNDATNLLNQILSRLENLTEFLPETINPAQLAPIVTTGAQNALVWLGQNTGQWLAELPAALFTTVLAILSWGYFLMSGRIFRITVLRFLFPWPDERALVRHTFSKLMRSLVVANLLVSLIQALIIGMFLAFTGIPHVLLWTSAAFFLSFIPVVGTAPVTLGSAAWCWLVAGRNDLAIAMILCAVIAGTSDNFIRPLVARGAGDLNPFWLFLSMIAGLAQFGPAGFLIGPFALAITLSSAIVLRDSLKSSGNKTKQCAT